MLGDYTGPHPLDGTFFHRYVFVVFEQPGEYPINFTETDGRSNFDLRKFAAKYRLGEPVAVNFFFSIFTPPTATPAAVVPSRPLYSGYGLE